MRERDAKIDDEPLACSRRTKAVEAEVHADLAHAAKRQEDQFVAAGL
jgi:hypothetical protein